MSMWKHTKLTFFFKEYDVLLGFVDRKKMGWKKEEEDVFRERRIRQNVFCIFKIIGLMY